MMEEVLVPNGGNPLHKVEENSMYDASGCRSLNENAFGEWFRCVS